MQLSEVKSSQTVYIFPVYICFHLLFQISEDVITIDSDSDGDNEPPVKRTYSRSRDVKPDVHKLNRQMAKEKNNASANSSDSVRDIKPDIATDTSGAECSTCREKEEKVKRVQQNLNDLRRNVWELMQVIVPDLELENMEMVDQVVVEMVRVNKRGDGENESQGSSETADGKDEDNNRVKIERRSVSQSGAEQNKRVNGNASMAANTVTGDEDETQDLSGGAHNHEDTSACNSCNGEIMPNEIKTKSEIKAENEESQSQSLLSNVQKSENKGSTVKER